MDDRVEYDLPFLEAAVRAAIDADPRAPAHHREREAIYALDDPRTRDREFGRLAGAWFRRLGLDAPIRRALAEQAGALAPVRRILVGPAIRPSDAGAELLVPRTGSPTLVLRLDPARCARDGSLIDFLRREILHVADMLDPLFLYEPRLPPQPAGPAHDRLIQDRYRLLWNCSVDGRLHHAGRLPASVRAARRGEFEATFPAAGAAGFGTIFDGPRPTHPDLVALAHGAGSGRTAHRCGLCGFPCGAPADDSPAAGLIDPSGLPPAVLATIDADFPGRDPADRVCLQCADLYRARAGDPEHGGAKLVENPA